MRFPIMAVLAATSLAVAPACKKKEEKPTDEPMPAEPKAAEPKAAEPTPPKPAADTMLNDMKNCPNAVAGAESTVALDEKTGLTAMITSKDPAMAKEIQTRAHALLDKKADAAATEIKHTGGGTGGGALGKCPAVVHDATATVADTAEGVTVTYVAADPTKLADMKTAIEARIKDMPAKPAADGAAPAGDMPAGDKPAGDKPAMP